MIKLNQHACLTMKPASDVDKLRSNRSNHVVGVFSGRRDFRARKAKTNRVHTRVGGSGGGTTGVAYTRGATGVANTGGATAQHILQRGYVFLCCCVLCPSLRRTALQGTVDAAREHEDGFCLIPDKSTSSCVARQRTSSQSRC